MLTAFGDSPRGAKNFMATRAPRRKLISPSELDAVIEQARVAGWRELVILGPEGAQLRYDGVPEAHTFYPRGLPAISRSGGAGCAAALNEAKLVVVGNEAVGKTSLRSARGRYTSRRYD